MMELPVPTAAPADLCRPHAGAIDWRNRPRFASGPELGRAENVNSSELPLA